MSPALCSFLRSGVFRRRSLMSSTYFISHSSFPQNYSSRSRNYSTNNHHQSAPKFPTTGRPLLMRPAVNVADGKIYDQLYDPLTGDYEMKERNKRLPDTAKIFASSRGWVGFVNPSRECSLCLVNPTHADAHVQPILLPVIESMSRIHGVKRRQSVDTFYVDEDDDDSWYSADEVVSKLLNSLVLSADPRDPECKAMIVFGHGIAFCKPGRYYGWMHEDRFHDKYRSKAFYQPVYSSKDRMFYHLVHDRDKSGLNGGDEYDIVFQDANIDPPRKGLCGYDWNRRAAEKTYLVVDEHSGDLFLVYKLHPFPPSSSTSSSTSSDSLRLNFEIHRLGSGGRILETVKSIGDLAFFIGPYECFALSANDFPQIQPNSIYLVHNELEGKRYSSAAVVYNLHDRCVTPFVCPYASCKLEQGAFWLAPSSLC